MKQSSVAQSLLGLLSTIESSDDLLAEVGSIIQTYTGADSCDIFFREHGDQVVLKASSLAPDYINRLRLGRGVGIIGDVVAKDEPEFILKNAQKDPRFARYPTIDHDNVEGLIISPLRSAQGRLFGIIVLRKNSPWKLSKARRAEILEVCQFGALIIRAHSAPSSLRYNRLGALSEVTKTIAQAPYLEEILQLLVNLTAQQFDYTVCTVRLLDERRNELVLRATQAPAKAYAKKRAIKLGESIAGRAISENRPIIVRDVQTEEDYIGHDLAIEQGLRSMICVPLVLQGRAVGVLSCYTSEVRDFGQDEIRALETLAKQAAVSIEHAKLQVRNTLMQEMHHRVKNNLQQVASLLRLQTALIMVITELVQNAIEHGFEVCDEGEIHVNVEQVVTEAGVDEVGIWVSNSGDKLPADFDPTKHSNLGLKIVDSLARGLGGTYKLADVLGWTVSEIRFPRASGE